MCDPITAAVAVAVTTVASTVGSVISAKQTAKAQAAALQQQHDVVAEENRKAASTELFDQMRATRREQARIRTAAGEAGLSLDSGSVEGLLMDSAMQGDLQGSRTLANLESRDNANDAQAQSDATKIESPTLLGAGLQIGSAVAKGVSGVESAKIKRS